MPYIPKRPGETYHVGPGNKELTKAESAKVEKANETAAKKPETEAKG